MLIPRPLPPPGPVRDSRLVWPGLGTKPAQASNPAQNFLKRRLGATNIPLQQKRPLKHLSRADLTTVAYYMAASSMEPCKCALHRVRTCRSLNIIQRITNGARWPAIAEFIVLRVKSVLLNTFHRLTRGFCGCFHFELISKWAFQSTVPR